MTLNLCGLHNALEARCIKERPKDDRHVLKFFWPTATACSISAGWDLAVPDLEGGLALRACVANRLHKEPSGRRV